MRPLLFALTLLSTLAACTSPGGTEGPAGAQGPAGPQGRDGAQGPAGPKGDPGTNGVDGAAGAVGAQGPIGVQGAVGPQGLQGPAGSVLVLDGGVVVGPAGSSVAVTPITAGGTICPTGGVRITQLSDAGITNVCNGAAGATGLTGPAGAIGMTGPAGATGMTGPAGAIGMTGPAGAIGMTGPAGASGMTGPAGAAGPTGATGPIGPAGPSGAPGSVLYLDGGVVLLSVDTITFAGYTPTAFNGNLGGFVGANAKCAAAFPGSSICTLAEFQKSNPAVAIGSGGAWADYNRYANGERNTSACANVNSESWSDNATNNFGPVLQPSGAYFTSGTAQNCSTPRPIACCFIPHPVIFVGYTAATYRGNLGGFVGANAKCASEYPGSWFCSLVDFHKADPSTAIGSGGAWADYNRYANGERNTSACANVNSESWSDSGGTNFGPVLQPSGAYRTSGTAQACSTLRPLTCCR